MHGLVLVLGLALFALPVLAIVAPRVRRPAAAALALVALGCMGVALVFASEGESLTARITHTFVAYEGRRIAPKTFSVEEVSGPAWRWVALAAAWALGWAAWARRVAAARHAPRVFGAPLALAWGGSALLLALQKAPAPEPLTTGLFGLPATAPATLAAVFAAAILLGRRCERVWHPFLYMALFTYLVHLPLAIFSTLATRGQWGTYLDVHTVDFVADPMTRTPVELDPGSTTQLWVVAWFPLLVLWPGLTWMSGGGLSFAVWMFRHAPEPVADSKRR